MHNQYTFDDVLIRPGFSYLRSRKDVDLRSKELEIELPIISANMDTVTGKEMALAMRQAGGIGCLHRFCSINENVNDALWGRHSGRYPIGSIGLGNDELERADALIAVGVDTICIDVAHGAQMAVVEQLNYLWQKHGNNIRYIVGNFASIDSIDEFKSMALTIPIFKVGVGPGSACTTRIKTGIGMPQLSAVVECYDQGMNKIIADGGMKTSGDIAKALAAGACSVMVGGMLAGTDETPGEIMWRNHQGELVGKDIVFPKKQLASGWRVLDESWPVDLPAFKKYRGSASKESYEAQGKSTDWRTAEGESFIVPYKGKVADVLKDIEGGLRSSFTYVGAQTLEEFREKAEFVFITGNALKENGAHGKT